MSHIKHSKQDVTDAVSMYNGGVSMRLVMQVFRVSHRLLGRWLDVAGVMVARRGVRDKYEIDLERLRGMCDGGLSERAMAAELGCSQGVIRRRKYDLGLLGDGKKW